MMVKMPKDDKRRKAIVEAYNAFAKHQKIAIAEDKGGKWMLLRYLPIPTRPRWTNEIADHTVMMS
jgi:hypothetical protein